MTTRPPVARSARIRPAQDPWAWVLLLIRVAVLVTVIIGVPDLRSASANRYHEIAHTSGVPYRDFAVEYPPLELALAELVGVGSAGLARVLLAVVAFAADLTSFSTIRCGWGPEAARRYLWLGTPLLVFIYRRTDLVSVALAATAMSLVWRRRERAGGIWLAAASLFRVWPAALVPALLVRRARSALAAFAVALAGGVIAWISVGGTGAIGQVATFRGASGWELESTVGALVWAATGEHRFEEGANRTGAVPGWARGLMLLILVVGTTAIWLKARRRGGDPVGPPALAAVALLLGVSPLLSPQYVAWLLPWGALAAASGRRWAVAAAAPLVLTAMIVASWYADLGLGPGWNQIVLTVRNVAILAIPVLYLTTGESPSPRARPS